MLGVPKLVTGLQKQLNTLLQENYNILDDFLYNLTTEDFNKKWEVAMWAQSIASQLEETNKIQERDKSRFQVI
jgi:dynein heavy chain